MTRIATFHSYEAAGFAGELLPIAPPGSRLSPNSSIQPGDVGKIPMKLGPNGWAGCVDWANKRYGPDETAAFQKMGAGIGVQGRAFPAVDIDVTLEPLAAEIEALALSVLGKAPARVGRAPKTLLPYRGEVGPRQMSFLMPADQSKPQERQMVEIRGRGAHWVAEGIHPKTGQPYTWPRRRKSADQLTPIDEEKLDTFFEALERLLVDRGATDIRMSRSGGTQASAPSPETLRAPSLDATREALKHIPNHGNEALDYDPWFAILAQIKGATGGSEEGRELAHDWSSGVLTGGAEGANPKYDMEDTERRWRSTPPRSGWPSLSRHAVEKSDGAFNAAAYVFGPLDSARPGSADGQDTLSLPQFSRDKHGAFKPTVSNLQLAIQQPGIVGYQIALDRFRGEILVGEGDDWQSLADEDYFAIQGRLEQVGFATPPRDRVRDAVHWWASRNSMDTAERWLASRMWDGVPRVDRFLNECFETADTEYHRACSRYIWTAHAGRVLDPGCVAAMVPVLIGRQGAGESRGVEAISPRPEFFDEFSFKEDRTAMARKMRGCLVGELAELQGLRTRELEEIKAWITATRENWTPKYKEMNTCYPRRLLMWGTSNDPGILADDTGERRWLPIEVGRVDVDRIVAERDQFWAEGAHLWRQSGVAYDAAERLARNEHARFRVTDPWEGPIGDWLNGDGDDGRPRRLEPVRIEDVLRRAVQMPVERINRNAEMRAGRVLTSLGLRKERRRHDGVPRWVWVFE